MVSIRITSELTVSNRDLTINFDHQPYCRIRGGIRHGPAVLLRVDTYLPDTIALSRPCSRPSQENGAF